MAESRWDSRREIGQRATFGFPEGKRRSPVLRRFHAHNSSSPASFPRPQRQGRCVIKPGVAPFPALPRVQAAARSLPRKGLCRSCPPGARYQRAEWNQVRGCGRGVRPEHISHIHTIPKHHMPPVRSFGTTLSGCLCIPNPPMVAPPRRYPGLCGRIPLGFPDRKDTERTGLPACPVYKK